MKSISNHQRFGWLSAVLVVGYFVVGCWPFNFRPLNQVGWLPARPGLFFGDDGIAYDPELLPSTGITGVAGQAADFTVELWVEAGVKPATDVFHILTIDDGRLPSPFVLCQWQQAIILRATTRDSRLLPRSIHEVGVDSALDEHNARVITVTGSEAGTDFYLDGVLAGHFPKFILAPEVLNGRMILGNSASGKQSWVGQFFGLALYRKALNAAEIIQHQALWTQNQARQLANAPNLMALYLFDEGSGRQVKDHSTNQHHLLIPISFQPLRHQFLIPPWRDMSYDTPNYRDIVVNVLGFVLFGFCFFLHRRLLRPAPWFITAWSIVVAGAVISLTIESIQVWLPNRTSSMTDLLGNTAGTAFGVILALAIRTKVAPAESISKFR